MTKKADTDLSRLFDSAESSSLSCKITKPPQVLVCMMEQEPAREACYIPCDAEYLELSSPGKKGSPSAKVNCSAKRSDDLSLDLDQLSLLSGDDLLLQLVAGYHRDGDYKPDEMKKASVNVLGRTSPACARGKHEHIVWKALSVDKTQNLKPLQEWVLQSVPTQFLLGRSTGLNSGNHGFLSRYWSFLDSRVSVHSVQLYSCGQRDNGEPVSTLKGRVEVFPDDRYELVIKIPPLGGWSGSKKSETYVLYTEKDKKGELQGGVFSYNKTEKRTSSNLLYDKQSTKNSTTTGRLIESETVTETKSTVNAIAKNEITIGFTDDKMFANASKKVDFGPNLKGNSGKGFVVDQFVQLNVNSDNPGSELKFTKEFTPHVSLKHNGAEIDIAKIINSILNFSIKFRDFFDWLKDAIPKIGFYWNYDLTFLEGSITGAWGVRNRNNATHARIWEVDRYGEIAISVALIKGKLEAGVGLESSIKNPISKKPLAEIKGTITIALSASVTIDGSCAIVGQKDYQVGAKGSIIVTAAGTLIASAAGYALLYIIEATAGIEVKKKFLVSESAAPKLEGTYYWIPLIARRRVSGGEGKIDEQEIFRWPASANDKIHIFSGDVLKGDEEEAKPKEA